MDWLKHAISEVVNNRKKSNNEEFEESRLPKKVGTAYCAMYVHGMHLRIKSAEEENVTYDSGVASVVLCQSRARA
jgi:hypothetical protein